MNVMFLAPSLTALGGGLERQARHLTEAILDVRPEAHVRSVLVRESQLVHPELLAARYRSRISITGSNLPRGVRRELAVARRALSDALWHRPDLVVCAHMNLGPLGAPIAALARCPLAIVAHGTEVWGRAHLPFGAESALRSADAVVAVSSYSAHRAVEDRGVAPEAVHVLSNPVDTDLFAPASPSLRPGAEPSPYPSPRILSVGRLNLEDLRKGYDVVLKAMASNDALRRGTYLIRGAGTAESSLRRQAEALGVRLVLLGPVPDSSLPELYRSADVFAMPSRQEGFGYVFVEAAACGVPIVAGRVDGSVDALVGGRLGLLVNPLSHEDVAQAILDHLEGRSAPEFRNPSRLHALAREEFGLARYRSRVDSILTRLGV